MASIQSMMIQKENRFTHSMPKARMVPREGMNLTYDRVVCKERTMMKRRFHGSCVRPGIHRDDHQCHPRNV